MKLRAPRWLALIGASLGMLLGALDLTVNVALPEITRFFATDVATIQWIIVLYVGTTTALQLALGSAADLYGLKRFYVIGIAAYTVAIVAIGLAPTLESVFALRVVQAVGNGLMLATGPALVSHLFPAESRGQALGMMTGIGTFGMIVGSLGGGLLVDQFSWHSIFLARTPLCLIALVLALVVLPEPPKAKTVRFDLLGASTSTVGLACLVLFLMLVGRLGGNNPWVIALGCGAVVALLFFVRFERRAERPILALATFADPILVPAAIAAFALSMATFVNLFILPFYASDILGFDAKTLGLLLTLTPVAGVGAAPLGGWLADRFSSAHISTYALAGTALNMYWFTQLDDSSTVLDVALRMATLGLGLGFFQAANANLIMSQMTSDRLGTGGSIISLSRSLGTVTSVAVISSLFAWLLASHRESAATEGAAFMAAFVDVYTVAAAIAAVGCAVSLACWRGARQPSDSVV